jgi:regulator of protease activity HflC (stomatin/prohibitin superfamily)
MVAVFVIVVLILTALLAGAMSVRIIKQYERVVLFELGKVKGKARGPGVDLHRAVC